MQLSASRQINSDAVCTMVVLLSTLLCRLPLLLCCLLAYASVSKALGLTDLGLPSLAAVNLRSSCCVQLLAATGCPTCGSAA
jgi:hypothetical protein